MAVTEIFGTKTRFPNPAGAKAVFAANSATLPPELEYLARSSALNAAHLGKHEAIHFYAAVSAAGNQGIDLSVYFDEVTAIYIYNITTAAGDQVTIKPLAQNRAEVVITGFAGSNADKCLITAIGKVKRR